MSYRVVVDLDLCQGHSVCQSEAPGVFSVPDRAGSQVTILAPEPSDELREAVELAVQYCPTGALRIEES